MQNMLLYYKYVIRTQYLLKHPEQIKKNIILVNLKKILFEIYVEDWKNNYYIYLYNMAMLLRLILNKIIYIKKIKKNYSINKVYLGINLKGKDMYNFIDIFTLMLLPLFESFNVCLDINKFDIFGNLNYKLLYFDPVFMSKNAVTVWSPIYYINIKFCLNSIDKDLNLNLLQYLGLKWYI